MNQEWESEVVRCTRCGERRLAGTLRIVDGVCEDCEGVEPPAAGHQTGCPCCQVGSSPVHTDYTGNLIGVGADRCHCGSHKLDTMPAGHGTKRCPAVLNARYLTEAEVNELSARVLDASANHKIDCMLARNDRS